MAIFDRFSIDQITGVTRLSPNGDPVMRAMAQANVNTSTVVRVLKNVCLLLGIGILVISAMLHFRMILSDQKAIAVYSGNMRETVLEEDQKRVLYRPIYKAKIDNDTYVYEPVETSKEKEPKKTEVSVYVKEDGTVRIQSEYYRSMIIGVVLLICGIVLSVIQQRYKKN